MSTRTYYDVLGLSRGATQHEITAAYRELAMQWHPDRNKSPEALARFQELNAAYQVLRDPDRRQTYDKELDRHGAQHENVSQEEAIRIFFEEAFNFAYELALQDFNEVDISRLMVKGGCPEPVAQAAAASAIRNVGRHRAASSNRPDVRSTDAKHAHDDGESTVNLAVDLATALARDAAAAASIAIESAGPVTKAAGRFATFAAKGIATLIAGYVALMVVLFLVFSMVTTLFDGKPRLQTFQASPPLLASPHTQVEEQNYSQGSTSPPSSQGERALGSGQQEPKLARSIEPSPRWHSHEVPDLIRTLPNREPRLDERSPQFDFAFREAVVNRAVELQRLGMPPSESLLTAVWELQRH